VNEPFNGILSLNSDGSFTYTHNGSENLTDSFTYKANDGLNDSNIATVNIAIGLTVNEPPLANDDYYSVDQGGILTIDSPGILGNDSDVDGDSLTAIKVSEPAYGMLILNSDGSFSYTHDGSENLTDSFSYVANDSKADSSNATVHISINYLGLFRTSSADDDWLDGWDNRPEIDINHTKIDSQLTHFPVLIHLSDSSGIHQEDVTQIFDEVGADFLKIAVSPIFPHLNHLHEHLG
jgi:VCBS repeat-containing protein